MGSLESDRTERLHFHFSLSCIGEGNGNPLQCSCLENPRDRKPGGLPSMGSQSRTWLKWPSSSSSVFESVIIVNFIDNLWLHICLLSSVKFIENKSTTYWSIHGYFKEKKLCNFLSCKTNWLLLSHLTWFSLERIIENIIVRLGYLVELVNLLLQREQPTAFK